MLTQEEEDTILKAWIADCDKKADTINTLLAEFQHNEPYMNHAYALTLYEKFVTPYHYFKQEYIERGLLQASASQAGSQGRESGSGSRAVESVLVTGPQTGTMAAVKEAAAQSKGPARIVVKQPSIPRTVVRAHVEGKTMPFKEYLKGRGGTWDPNRKVWVFRILGDAFEGFCKEIKSRGLKVVTDEVE